MYLDFLKTHKIGTFKFVNLKIKIPAKAVCTKGF